VTGDPNAEAPEARPAPSRERPTPDPFVSIAAAVSPRAREAISARAASARLPYADATPAQPPARSLRARLRTAARRALSTEAALDEVAPKPNAGAPRSLGGTDPSAEAARDAPEPMAPDKPAPRTSTQIVARLLFAFVLAVGDLGAIAWLTLAAPPDGPVPMTVEAVAPTAPPLRQRASGASLPARGPAPAATPVVATPPLNMPRPPSPGAAPWVGPADVQGAPRIARLPAPRPTARGRD